MTTEIYFDDLTTEKQKQLLNHYDADKPEELNWDTLPLVEL